MKWTHSTYRPGLEMAIPTTSGIYVIAAVERFEGLPLETRPLYVGKSKNLRRRTRQHHDLLEPNPHLNGVGTTQALEIWWTRVAEDELDDVEDNLIAALDPPANRRKRRGKHKASDDKGNER